MVRRDHTVVEKSGTIIGGGAGLGKANVEIVTVSGEGTVDIAVSRDELAGMRNCAWQRLY